MGDYFLGFEWTGYGGGDADGRGKIPLLSTPLPLPEGNHAGDNASHLAHAGSGDSLEGEGHTQRLHQFQPGPGRKPPGVPRA